MSLMSDDNEIMKRVRQTHAPNGRKVDVKPPLLSGKNILERDNLKGFLYEEDMEDKSYQASFNAMPDALSIEQISRELATVPQLSGKALTGDEAHLTPLAICNMLAPFSWDAKLVLTLVAFAKFMAIPKQLPMKMEHSGALKSWFDVLNSLIQAMLEVTMCVVVLMEIPSAYISSEVPALLAAMAHVPTAVYWTIRSAVACASQITSLTSYGLGPILSTTEAWELSTLDHKLKNTYEHLQKQIAICNQYIEEKRHLEDLRTLLNPMKTICINNMEILNALINPKDNIQPLVEGSTKQRVNLKVLTRNFVLLLISGLDISQDELSILEQIHIESNLQEIQYRHKYKVVWIPMVDRSVKWTNPMQKQFEALQSRMQWYTVYDPSLIHKGVIRFITEQWRFRNKPILVVLDPEGKVVSPNAIHMMWIWRQDAFPFTKQREEALWRKESWRLELLVDRMDPTILNWIKDGKYIFLYGGDDIEWIRDFTAAARRVALAAKIHLEMVYMGRSSKRDKVQCAIDNIDFEKLSNTWRDLTLIWFFWTRLESMHFSKIQLGMAYDPLAQQIKKLQIFDKAGGWAMLSKGSSITVNGNGTTVLQALLEYNLWKVHVPTKGFDQAFKDHHDMTWPNCQFKFRSMAGKIPESIQCPECQVLMERLTTFVCCRDDAVPSIYE